MRGRRRRGGSFARELQRDASLPFTRVQAAPRASHRVDLRARALVLTLVAPGSAHLLFGVRRTEGALLVAFDLAWGVLAVVQLATLSAHIVHVGPEAYPGIVAAILLYPLLYLIVGGIAAANVLPEIAEAPAPRASPA